MKTQNASPKNQRGPGTASVASKWIFRGLIVIVGVGMLFLAFNRSMIGSIVQVFSPLAPVASSPTGTAESLGLTATSVQVFTSTASSRSKIDSYHATVTAYWQDKSEQQITETAIAGTATAELARDQITAWSPMTPLPNLVLSSKVGPFEGSLIHKEEGFIETRDAGVKWKNFIAQATFYNPYDASYRPWDYGLLFRDAGTNSQYRIVIRSVERKWQLSNRVQNVSEIVGAGSIAGLRSRSGESNFVKLICYEDTGWLYVNDQFIAQFELSSRSSHGAIEVATGMWEGDESKGYSTRYSDFIVWEISVP